MSGGSGGENVWYNDLYYLDLRTTEWTKVEMEGNPPQPRDYLTLCHLSNLVRHKISLIVSCITLKYYANSISLSSVSSCVWWIQ